MFTGIFQLWKIGVSAPPSGITELQGGEEGGKSREATSLQIRVFSSWDEKDEEGPLPVAGCGVVLLGPKKLNTHFLWGDPGK